MAATGGAVGRALGIGAAVCAALTVASVVALGVVQDQLDQGVTHATIVSSRESADYAAWKDPKRIRTSFYVFNVSNADRLPFGESPVFTEHGPFVYESLKTKLDPEFDRAADSVTYFERNWFRFRRDLSVADDSFEFTTLNIPFWGVIANARSLGDQQKHIDSILVKLLSDDLGWATNGTHLYSMTRSVHEILFGYADDPLLSAIHSSFRSIPQDYPGLQNNESSATARQQGPLRARIGAHDPSVISHLDMWNNQTVISYCRTLNCAPEQRVPSWTTREASRVGGSNGQDFGRGLQAGCSAPLFIDQLRREAPVENVDRRRVSVKGVSALRFVLSESVLQNASVNPANLDYHMTRGHGVLPLSTVYQNVPLVATKPHFLDTYPSLEARGRSMGLAPTQADHDTYLDVEPNTGLPLRFHKRLMFSLDVGPVTLPTMKSTAQLVPKMAPGFFPLIWGDENFVINQEDADELHTMRTASHLVNNVLPIVIAASAGAAILLMVAYGFVVARAGTAGARVGPPYSAL